MTAPWFELPNPEACGWDMPPSHSPQHSTAIIGAGIAGLCAARALLKNGFPVTLYDAAADCAAGASASPAGIIKPYVNRQPSDAMRFYTEAYETLFQWLPELDNHGGLVSCGALQLIDRNFPKNPNVYESLSAEDASEFAGVQLNQDALSFKQAGWLSVHRLCHILLADVMALGGKFKPSHHLQTLAFDADEAIWNLTFDNDSTTTQISHKTVLLTSGAALAKCTLLPNPELIAARGQLTQFTRSFALNTVVSGNNYAIPTSPNNEHKEESVWVGATFDRGNDNSDCLAGDDLKNQTNIAELLPHLQQPVNKTTNSFAAVRCTTMDRLPILGPVPNTDAALNAYGDIRHGRPLTQYPTPKFHQGLAVIGGLGSRGIALAPYAAELFVDWLAGGDKLNEQNRLVSPLRFLIRGLKRGD